MQKCVWRTNGIQLPNQGSGTQQNSGMSLVFICLVVWKKLLEILRDVYKKRTKNVISPDWASRQIKIKNPDWSNGPPWTGPAAKKFQIPHLLFHSKISINVVFKELLICWCFSWSICACFQVPHFTSATWTKRTDCDKAEKPTVKSLGTGFFQIPWILWKTRWIDVGLC